MKALLVSVLALALLAFAPALVPTASASASCTVAKWAGHVGASCQTEGASTTAVAGWCTPDGTTCYDRHPITCAIDLTPRAFCYI